MSLSNRELVDERILYLDSKSRLNPNTSDIFNSTYQLPPFSLSVNSDEYLEVGLQSFVTKYTFYNIDTGRNADIDVSTTGAAGSYTSITLEVGNYSAKDMIADMQTKLRTVTGLSTLSLAYKKGLFKILFTNLPGTPANVVLRFPVNETGYELFGFNIGDTTLNGDGTRSVNLGQLTGGYPPRVLSIGNEEALFLNINFGASSNISMNESSTAIKNTFAKVHIVAPFNGNIYFFQTEASNFRVQFPVGSSADNQIEISVTDEVGNFIKLQSDFQLVIKIRKFRNVETKDQKLLANVAQLLAVSLARQNK